jgi:hypothetical protein
MNTNIRISIDTSELTIDELDIVSGGSAITDLAHAAAQAALNAGPTTPRSLTTKDLTGK